MKRSRRAVAAAFILGAVSVVIALSFEVRTAGAQSDPGSRALEYLESQQSASDGSVPGGFSVDDLYVIGAAAGGYDPSLLSHGGPSVMSYLGANAAAACPLPTDASPSAGGCGELIQAALAAGRDPAAFGGLDLLSRLDAYLDPSTGKFGDGEAFTQALAIQALAGAGRTVPAAALTFLHNAEDSDGGWDFKDVRDDPNAATNFDTSDTNSTAMVLMALDAGGDHSRDAAALAWVHPLQNTDGGFSFQGGGSDPDSTALVLQAILGAGQDPGGAAWTVAGHTPAAELVASQDPGGGYTFPGNSTPDAFTTSQVPAALFGRPLPVAPFSQAFVPSLEHRASLNALLYLESQQSASDGSVPGGFSVDDLYVIGAAAGGYDPSLLSHGGPSVMSYLGANAAAACPLPTDASPSAGGCGELIQAALAAGRDPAAFGGLDLLSRLDAYLDPSTGKFGDGEAFTQALAIQALAGAGRTVPAAALTFLHNAEDSDGGWDFKDVRDDPNAATNFDTSDTNSTAMVLMALDAGGDHSRDAAALAWVHPLQNTDGGFSFQGGGSDPDSTALVLQAILGAGQDPGGAAWTVAGHTPAAELVASQDPGGGYTFPGNSTPDAFTTSQVPFALDGFAYPAPFASRQLYTPGTPLGGQAPPPTPTPAPSTGPSAGVISPAAATPSNTATSSASHGPPSRTAPATPRPAATPSPAPASPTATAATPAPSAATTTPAARPGIGAIPGAPSGGFPSAILYAAVGLVAAAIAAGLGLVVARR